ncbi:MAG: phosphotransferase [Desulfobulbus sp.]|jgi:Ser/Thr protein kinase RdoA (MazF antagonist)|nr:phosphotransferase [Desulfobulbus sp.]
MHTSDALNFFLPGQDVRSLSPLGAGNINHTWLVVPEQGLALVLQRLHPGVFADPQAVMANMRLITRHLAAADPPITFRLRTSPDGADCFVDAADCCWRLLSHIGPARTLAPPLTAPQVRAIGGLLGRFHHLVADLDPDSLADPLPDFHITSCYLAQYDALGPPLPRSELERFCADTIETHRSGAESLEAARERLRHQVIHGDPKSSNVLFAAGEDRALALIDLDTVKPGLLLHDLGDCLRSCCNRLGEEGEEGAGELFAADLFQALVAGYRDAAGDLLGPADRALLVESARLISYELGLRFFTDHLAGDRYFKVNRPGQNLHRAAVQFRLHASIQRQRSGLDALVAGLFA